jgi:nucleotide-binding universal stress UspA family protein
LHRVKNDAEKWFNIIKEKGSNNGIRLRTGLVVSSIEVDDAIVNYAERENVDLIVIGEEEKSGLKQRLHTTTAAQKMLIIIQCFFILPIK